MNNTNKKAPELSVTSEKLDKIIRRIDSWDIRIPAFQRAYVWKQEQILDLLDSILKNYPVWSILLWETEERLNHTRNIAWYKIPETKESYPVNYVLDWQQRISSIYATFSEMTEQDISSKKYNPDLDLFEIYYDFSSKRFLPKNEIIQDNDNTICLRWLLNWVNAINIYTKLNTKYHTEFATLHSKFNNYELPVVWLTHREKDEVWIIFERINNTGTRLTTLDLMTAWTWTDNFHLLESITSLQEELEEKNFGDLTQNILLQAISWLIQNDTTTKAITKLTWEQVRDNWEKFSESLRKSIDFISTTLNCSHLDFLPYQQQIVILTKFFSFKSTKNEARQIKELTKWFWKTSFSNRYSTWQTTEKMNSDIQRIIEIRGDNFNEINKLKYSVSKNELIETKFSKANPLTRSFLLLMAQNSPMDLVKNTKIDIVKSLSKYNRKEYHHIFPNAFLKKQGFPQEKIFSVTNFCFLPTDSNKKITNKSPSDYFFSLIPLNDFNIILGSNLIPLTKELYLRDNYNDFLEKRAELIITEIDKLTN